MSLHVPTGPDSGLSRLHRPPDGLLVAESELKRWQGRIQRAITKLNWGDDRRAIEILMELKAEIKAARGSEG
jgi:hypothetical protein